ncbi:MAG TPA: hypothetical protein VGL40_03425 [Bacillota bacterium]|jgi:hypothetical protein
MERRKSPLLAGILGLVPGLGQLYNEQWVKGFGIVFLLALGFALMVVQPMLNLVGVNGGLLSGPDINFGPGFPFNVNNSGEIFTAILYVLVIFPVVWLYSLFDAIFTARRFNDAYVMAHAQAPIPSPAVTPSAHTAVHPAPSRPTHHRPLTHSPADMGPREGLVWGVGLVALGLLGLAATLDGGLWWLVKRGWPMLLILGGAYFLWAERFGAAPRAATPPSAAPDPAKEVEQ